MPPLVDLLRRHLLANSRSSRTVRTYVAVAAAFFACLGGRDPARGEVESFLARPRADGARRAAAGRNQELAALRALAAFAVREGRWPANPTDGVPFSREAPRDPVVLGAGEVGRFFRAAAEHPPAGERAQALAVLAFLSQAGLRVHELVALDLGQVDLASGTLLSVKGKGNTVHDLPLNAPAAALVSGWLSERSRRVASGERALFVSDRGTRLSARTVENWVAHLRAHAGTAKKVTPHTFRHSAATLALTMGTDLATVGELLRHSDLNTTRRYLHLVDARRREAVGKLAATVPADLLGCLGRAPAEAPSPPPAARVLAPLPANDTLPAAPDGPLRTPPEAPASIPSDALDGQCGFVAKSFPCDRRSESSDQHGVVAA